MESSPEEAVTEAFGVVEGADTAFDLVVFPELFSLPFWCVGLSQSEFFDWAEDHEGPTLTTAREWVTRLGCHAVVPFFERGGHGFYYNSTVVLGPDGSTIPGVLAGGERVQAYRKNAISSFNWTGSINDEKYYFRPGPGYPVFDTAVGRLGVLICYDRWFSEAWRLLALAGAEVVCVPNASSGVVSDLFVPSMRTWAAQNVLYAVAVNRAGDEHVGDATTHYYGLSCVTSPRGKVLAEAPEGEPALISAEIDLEDVAKARHDHTMYRDRRPELYGPLAQE